MTYARVLATEQRTDSVREPRAPQARGRATRERLLESAKELFARRGYDGTSIGDVARAAGVGVGTVYHHFSEKREILLELLERHEGARLYGDWAGPLTESMGASDSRSALEKVLHLIGEVRRHRPSIYGISLDLARRDEEIAAHCQRIEDEHRELMQRDLETAQQAGLVRPEVDAKSCAAWLHLLVYSNTTMLGEAESPEELAPLTRELAEIICDRLLPR